MFRGKSKALASACIASIEGTRRLFSSIERCGIVIPVRLLSSDCVHPFWVRHSLIALPVSMLGCQSHKIRKR